MGGRLDAFGVEFLDSGRVIEDHTELCLVTGQLLVAQPQSGEPRNMSNIDIDGHPLSVGVVASRVVGTNPPR